jgi:hypothetical protein
VQTSVTRAFDFGDDDTDWYKTEARTYVIRHAACAAAFGQLNAGLHARLTGPEQQSRERRRFWIVAVIIIAIWLLGWLMTSNPTPKTAHPANAPSPLCAHVGDKEWCAPGQAGKH